MSSIAEDIQLQRFEWLAYGDSATPFRGAFMGLWNEPPPVVEAKTQCESAHYLNLKYIFFSKYLFCILISLSQIRNSYLKLIKKYIFSEGEQFPLKVNVNGTAYGSSKSSVSYALEQLNDLGHDLAAGHDRQLVLPNTDTTWQLVLPNTDTT